MLPAQAPRLRGLAGVSAHWLRHDSLIFNVLDLVVLHVDLNLQAYMYLFRQAPHAFADSAIVHGQGRVNLGHDATVVAIALSCNCSYRALNLRSSKRSSSLIEHPIIQPNFTFVRTLEQAPGLLS